MLPVGIVVTNFRTFFKGFSEEVVSYSKEQETKKQRLGQP
jgi:hypothetical protein